MDLEKTIKELLKKYYDEQKYNNTKNDINSQNVEKSEKETEKNAENGEFWTPKMESTKNDVPVSVATIFEKEQAETVPFVAKDTAEEIKVDTTETPKTLEAVEREIEKLDEKYKPVTVEEKLPEYLELERKEMPTKTAEEIETSAEQKVEAEKAEKVDAVNQKADEKIEKANEQKKTISENFQATEDSINTAYDAVRVKAENDALRRGLARSSIVCLELSGIETERAKELTKAGKDLEAKLGEIEKNLQSLESERIKSLEALDVSYASKLQDEIDKQLAELQKRRDEVLEYNNKVTELEHKYNISVDKTREEAKAKTEKQVAEENAKIENEKKAEIVELLTNYFSKFDSARRVSELKKHSDIADKYGVDVYYLVYRNLISEK